LSTVSIHASNISGFALLRSFDLLPRPRDRLRLRTRPQCTCSSSCPPAPPPPSPSSSPSSPNCCCPSPLRLNRAGRTRSTNLLRRPVNLYHAHIEMTPSAKAPMLMKPATSGVAAPPEKDIPGCKGGGDDDEVEGSMVVVVVVGESSAGFVSVDTMAAEVTVLSPGVEVNEEGEDIAGGQGCGTRCEISPMIISPLSHVWCPSPFPTVFRIPTHHHHFSQ
jgi:hypothetical protein